MFCTCTSVVKWRDGIKYVIKKYYESNNLIENENNVILKLSSPCWGEYLWGEVDDLELLGKLRDEAHGEGHHEAPSGQQWIQQRPVLPQWLHVRVTLHITSDSMYGWPCTLRVTPCMDDPAHYKWLHVRGTQHITSDSMYGGLCT